MKRHLTAIMQVHRGWLATIRHKWQTATFDERVLGLLAVTLPLERVPAVDVAGVTIRLSVVFGALLVCRTAYRLAREQKIPEFTRFELLLLLFALWNIVVLVGVRDSAAAAKIVIPTLYVIGLALAVPRSLRPKQLPLIVGLVCVGAVGACLFGIYQFIGDYAGLPHWLTAMRAEYSWQRFGFPRIVSTALEPLFLSAYLLLPISLVLSYFGHAQTRYRQAGLLLVATLLIGVDVLTVSRGGILALAMLLLVTALFIAYAGRRHAALRYVGQLAVVVAVAVVLGLGFLAVFSRKGLDSDVTYGSQGITTFTRHLMNTHVKPTAANVQNEDSVAARSTARDRAVAVIQASPRNTFFGVGPGQYQAYNIRTTGDGSEVVANVLPLDIMLNYGLGGIVLLGTALLLLFGKLLRQVKRQNVVAGALAAYLLALGLQSLTFPTLYITHLWFALGLALVVTGAVAKPR